MRPSSFLLGICAFFVCNSVVAPSQVQAQFAKATPLILEKEEGERRVWRPIEGLESQLSLFILKVDPHNGGSSHLVMGTEDIPPEGKIDAHRHSGSDEILVLQNGLAKINLGATVKEVHAGATLFIPSATWISAVSTGKEATHFDLCFLVAGVRGIHACGIRS